MVHLDIMEEVNQVHNSFYTMHYVQTAETVSITR